MIIHACRRWKQVFSCTNFAFLVRFHQGLGSLALVVSICFIDPFLKVEMATYLEDYGSTVPAWSRSLLSTVCVVTRIGIAVYLKELSRTFSKCVSGIQSRRSYSGRPYRKLRAGLLIPQKISTILPCSPCHLAVKFLMGDHYELTVLALHLCYNDRHPINDSRYTCPRAPCGRNQRALCGSDTKDLSNGIMCVPCVTT
jgi:hypothetical protein